MKNFIKILIIISSTNIFSSTTESDTIKKHKALVILNMHKDSLNNLKLNQELCYLPEIIKNILIKHSSSDRLLNKKSNIFNLLNIKNEIKQILPTLQNQDQIDILTEYFNKIDSGNFRIYLNRPCGLAGCPEAGSHYVQTPSNKASLCCPHDFNIITSGGKCFIGPTGASRTISARNPITVSCSSSVPTT